MTHYTNTNNPIDFPKSENRMSELIEGLWWKARIGYNNQAVEPEVLEKFAELIVRECGVALNPMLRDMVSRGQAFDLIKKHFGVEE